MGILQRLGLTRRSYNGNPLSFSTWFQALGEVAERRALGQSAVWSAINTIVGDLSSLPINVYDRTPDGGRVRIDLTAKAYLPWMLRVQPNSYQTAPVFIGAIVYDLVFKTNAFVFKSKNIVGEVVELHRMNPEMVEVIWDGSRKWFRYDGAIFSTDEIIHIMGLTIDGFRGLSLFEVGNKTITAACAVDEYAGTYFKNSSTPAGILTTEEKVAEPGRKQAKADWEGLYSGPSNQHKIAVLAGSWKFQPVSSNAKDAQLLEARQFTIGDIARLFRIPPYKLGDATKVSYSSIEIMQIEYWQSCLRPLAVRIEAAFNVGLIPPSAQGYRFVEFDYSAIVKPDSAGMASLLDKLVKAGLMTLNEARAKLNLNRVDGGDILLVPQNQAQLVDGEIKPINQISPPGGNA